MCFPSYSLLNISLLYNLGDQISGGRSVRRRIVQATKCPGRNVRPRSVQATKCPPLIFITPLDSQKNSSSDSSTRFANFGSEHGTNEVLDSFVNSHFKC